MLSTALLRFPHGERSGKTEPPGWAVSHGPLPGSVLKPPPRPWLMLPPLRLLWLLPLHSLWAFPSLLGGFGFIHPSLLAPSQQPAAGWQGLGRRPARSALPRQNGTTLASPQGASSCAPLVLPSRLHRRCMDPNAALCAWAGASSTPPKPSEESLPTVPGLHLTLPHAQTMFFLPVPALPARVCCEASRSPTPVWDT